MRQNYPVAVLVCTSAAALAYYPPGFPDAPIALSFVVALYTVARDRSPVLSVSAAVLLVLAFSVLPALHADGLNGMLRDQVQTVIGVAPILLLTVVLGEVARTRARHVAQAEQRAALAEATRESEASGRAMEERLRIARELHDVVAHQISLIHVQASAALRIRSPEPAFEALEAIRTTSNDALREVRAVLSLLRQADRADPVQPGPSLARLRELIAGTEAAGLPVRSSVKLAATALPATVDAAAYRIMQEALTNAIRHSSASSAGVVIRQDGGQLMVTVEDDGEGPVDPETLRNGNGLRGMTERAIMIGGRIQALPRPEGGFTVRARLPVTLDESGHR
ncbi:sensor histidine kinase [Actinoplanes aureus]|uniref:histidine kinase n=1 Tax=Actinoplanes aureus TaxID=2792083 RepID=A0A931CA43_9ACTN|nr:sensor histidine kinase [Actinoplanes aureus]MBG0563661.1 sensor histidine kinase [Actinoplanes aureus]